MRKNIQRTQAAIALLKQRLLVMELWAEGHPIEFRLKGMSDWYSVGEIDYEPSWDWDNTDYHIKKQSL